MTSLYAIDFVIVILLILGALFGLKKGIVKSVISLFGIVLVITCFNIIQDENKKNIIYYRVGYKKIILKLFNLLKIILLIILSIIFAFIIFITFYFLYNLII